MWNCICGQINEDNLTNCSNCLRGRTYQPEYQSAHKSDVFVSYHKRGKMEKKRRTNPFEYLRISPDADNQDIVEHGRELAIDASPEEKQLIRQAVLEITTHPLKRLEYEVFTYYGAEYEDSHWTESEKEFLWHLTSFLRGKDHRYQLEYGLLRNFYDIITQNPVAKNLHSVFTAHDEEAIKLIWDELYHSNKKNCWFIHTLALLHQEWAEEFEDQREVELSSLHWQESRKYWFTLYPKEKFWKYFEDNNLELKGDQFLTFVVKFPKKLLDVHQNRLQEYLIQKKQNLARIHFNCIKLAQKERDKRIKSMANELIENLTSKFLQEAKEKLKTGKMPEGIRENYEAAISCIEPLLELDPYNKRVLQFVVEQYNRWGYDLYTMDDRTGEVKLVEKSKPFAKKLVSQITKGQGYVRDNQIVAENLLMQGFSTNDLNKAIALYKESLEYYPEFENAKKLLEDTEVRLLYETFDNVIKAINDGDFNTAVRNIKSIPADHEEYHLLMERLAVAFNNEGLRIVKEKGDFNKAIKYLEKAVELNPYDEKLQENLDVIKNRKAELPYESALKQANDAWNDGDDDKVINYLKKIPTNFTGYDEIKKFLALAYNRRGVKKANATSQYQLSDSSDISLYKDIIVSMLKGALEDLESAFKYDPYDTQIKNNLNSIRQNLKAFETLSSSPYQTDYNYGYGSSKSYGYSPTYNTKTGGTGDNFIVGILKSWWFWFGLIYILGYIFKWW